LRTSSQPLNPNQSGRDPANIGQKHEIQVVS
jgi:hypothetical protein